MPTAPGDLRTHLSTKRHFGRPWLALCLTLAVHVADEALTGFLDAYNPTVTKINQYLGFALLPTFTFHAWIGLLLLTVVALLALTPLAYRPRWGFIPVGYAFLAVMFINGVINAGVSLWHRE